MKFILYTLLAIELVVSMAAAASLHPEVLGLVAKLDTNKLDGKEVVSIVKQLESLVEKVSAPKSVVELVEKLAPFSKFTEKNCTLAHFNSLTSLADQFKTNKNIAHFLDYCRSEQLLVCHQKDPKFSTMIAMNGNPSHFNY